LLLAEVRVSADGRSQLDGLWDSLSTAVMNAIDGYAWILPALVLTALFFGLIVLIAWCTEDLPFELDIFEIVGGIFKWTRKWWRGESLS
jgi:hypothetical protein